MTTQQPGVAVVSGASSGFGARIAVLLARQGYSVVALARRAERLAELAAGHPDLRIHPLAADVRQHDELAAAFAALPPSYQDITAVVNNAGLSRGFGTIHTGDPASWQEMIDTNVVGLLNLTHVLLPRLVRQGRGHVVNVGSIAASYPYLGGNVYGATKAFVHQLTLNMRADLEGTGIRVSCVAPGMAKTEFALVRFDGDTHRADRLYDGVTPLSPDDVAEAVGWCLTRPPHVNVNMIEIMPTDQAFSLGFGTVPAVAGTGDGDAA
jgi:NADP-dependent 3-hydroxy acid dehydrogenase YdfG